MVLVRQTGLEVAVMWQGQAWDLLMPLDVLAAPCANGYACALCDDLSQTWPTLDALWADHLCEPLLSWVNQRLGPARWLVLGAVGDGFIWARLHGDPAVIGHPARVVAQLRLHQHAQGR